MKRQSNGCKSGTKDLSTLTEEGTNLLFCYNWGVILTIALGIVLGGILLLLLPLLIALLPVLLLGILPLVIILAGLDNSIAGGRGLKSIVQHLVIKSHTISKKQQEYDPNRDLAPIDPELDIPVRYLSVDKKHYILSVRRGCGSCHTQHLQVFDENNTELLSVYTEDASFDVAFADSFSIKQPSRQQINREGIVYLDPSKEAYCSPTMFYRRYFKLDKTKGIFIETKPWWAFCLKSIDFYPPKTENNEDPINFKGIDIVEIFKTKQVRDESVAEKKQRELEDARIEKIRAKRARCESVTEDDVNFIIGLKAKRGLDEQINIVDLWHWLFSDD